MSSHISFWKLESPAVNDPSTKKLSSRDASAGCDDAQRNVTCGCRCGSGNGAQGQIAGVELQLQCLAFNDDVGEYQPSLEIIMSQLH